VTSDHVAAGHPAVSEPADASPAALASSVPASARSVSTRALEVVNRFGLLLAWAVVIVVFTGLRPDTFPTKTNLIINLNTQAVLVIMVISVLPALAAGLFDLSIAGVLGLSSTLVGYLNVLHHWPVGAAIVVALLSGLVVGLVNSFLIVWTGIDSLIVTIGMGTLLSGVSLGINGNAVSGLSSSFVNFFRWSVDQVQVVFLLALLLTILCWYMFSHTPLGRYLFVVGAGRDVARLSGLRVKALQVTGLLTASVGAALAGVALAGSQGSVDPHAAAQLLLPAFAAAYLGSTTLKPGRFNAWGAFIAVYFLATGITGLQFLGLSGWIEDVFYGGSLVLAVFLSYLARRRATTTG
jgi:ribose transport system permease protein